MRTRNQIYTGIVELSSLRLVRGWSIMVWYRKVGLFHSVPAGLSVLNLCSTTQHGAEIAAAALEAAEPFPL